MQQLIKRHPITAYFIIAFAFSWVMWAGLVLNTPPGGMQAGISPAFFVMAILGGFGPSLAGVAVTWAVDGKQGVQALFARLQSGRVRWGWYLTALIPFAER